MRIAKGQKLTEVDRKELALFGDFVRAVAKGQDQMCAYAEIYGETIYDASKKASQP